MGNYRFYKKQIEGGGFDYFQAEEVEDSNWVLITVNFDYKCKIKAAVGQHLIDQPEIKRADEILSGCEEILYMEYSQEEECWLLIPEEFDDDEEEEKKKVVFHKATSKRRKPVPGAEPIEAIVVRSFTRGYAVNFFSLCLIVEVEGELVIVNTNINIYDVRTPSSGEIVIIYWDEEYETWSICNWKRQTWMYVEP